MSHCNKACWLKLWQTLRTKVALPYLYLQEHQPGAVKSSCALAQAFKSICLYENRAGPHTAHVPVVYSAVKPTSFQESGTHCQLTDRPDNGSCGKINLSPKRPSIAA